MAVSKMFGQCQVCYQYLFEVTSVSASGLMPTDAAHASGPLQIKYTVFFVIYLDLNHFLGCQMS